MAFCVLRRSNEARMNFLKADADDNDVLFSTRDSSGNTFDVRKSGRHAFYGSDCYEVRECQQCIHVRDEFELEHFGERCIVLNRDNSGELNDFHSYAELET